MIGPRFRDWLVHQQNEGLFDKLRANGMETRPFDRIRMNKMGGSAKK